MSRSLASDVAISPFLTGLVVVVVVVVQVYVFDLSINKYEPVCEQQVVSKKARLTRLAFNPREPLLLVGDDKGCVSLFSNLIPCFQLLFVLFFLVPV
jgi:dynein intermediate chain 1